MDFTFGIITGGGEDEVVNKMIDSIESQNMPNYEIIVVGGNNINRKNVRHIAFNENIKPMWITRKYNIIVENALYENLVLMHSFVALQPGWYEGFLKFGNNFNVCMSKILTIDDKRYADWILWIYDISTLVPYVAETRECMIPYDMMHLQKYMYIQHTYFVAKKSIMKEFPLNEELSWGQGEDLLWSMQYRRKYKFSMNIHSTVKLLKPKGSPFSECSEQTIKIYQKLV